MSTKARSVEGQGIKKYVGKGRRAAQAARERDEARLQRELQHQDWINLWSNIGSATRTQDALGEQSKQLTSAALLAGGFHFHKGHKWRRRKIMVQTTGTQRSAAHDRKMLDEHIKLANAGDPDAVAWLRAFLDANPQVWGTLGDLARTSERAWIDLISNRDELSRESIRRHLLQLKTDLVGEAPSVVEKMLGDQVIATWLEVKYLETVSADLMGTTNQQVSMASKRVESAQKRHLTAIRSLVEIRKLLPTAASGPMFRIFTGQREAS